MMQNSLLIFFIVLSVSFAISYLAILHKLKRLSLTSAQLFLENFKLNQDAESIKANQELTDNDIHRENFIKFLSDSRDWAFTYIEDVQKGLTKFVEEVDPTINYFLEFGSLQEGNPLNGSMKKISTAYVDLKKFLPNESEIKNT
jgi:hypothetical protein